MFNLTNRLSRPISIFTSLVIVLVLLYVAIEPKQTNKLHVAQTIVFDGLSDHLGKPVNQAAFQGHWSLINFGYTNCPDVCPTNLLMLSKLLKRYQDTSSNPIEVHLATVDPTRDTPDILRQYLQFFNPDMKVIWGSEQDLSRFASQTGNLFSIPQVQPSELYAVDHSDNIAVINPNGLLEAIFTPPHDLNKMDEALRQLISNFE